ncbi:hypothetical protein [Emticicia sp. C21]|uniref:hypothetical protein n=1 Tax=Emticicia sp. C21 TaxID=2302915 RepID=UPI000E340951|nr:hypothetical protein [Emticicia sp. C21]RFS16320.1 hypothetical protein D0T08_11575 [Emticicia sp. C21]
MKTKLNLLLIFLLGITVSGFASTAASADLEYKEQTIDDKFAKVEKLEQYLAAHPEATLETVKKTNPELLKGFDLIETTETNFSPTKEMPIVGGFWWGCCLGIVGLGLVYFITDNDKDQVRQALWGCIIATILWSVGGLWNPFGWF